MNQQTNEAGADDQVTALHEVRLGAQTVQLKAPTRRSVLVSIAIAIARNEVLGNAAALGVCWDSPYRPKARFMVGTRDPYVFGDEVFEELSQRKGVSSAALLAAGQAAALLILDAIPSEEKVAAEMDFSEAPTAAQT